jgi:hypothetical protein
VEVGEGVWVGVLDGVGVLVIVWVGGENWAVCVCAAAAVSKIIVSTARDDGAGLVGPETGKIAQAETTSANPTRETSGERSFRFIPFSILIT